MKPLHVISLAIAITSVSCKQKKFQNKILTVGHGQMPSAVHDHSGNLYLVYGNGDSILYVLSSNGGEVFTTPALVAVLPNLAASHSRGPQIATTEDGVSIIACNSAGDIFSYINKSGNKWLPGARINDVDTTAKEGLMALSGDGHKLFAVWLDLRDKHNKIFGASSQDGGQNWSANKLIYASPDTTVCECCKPSIYVKGDHVNIMFRNWLGGNRDLYLTRSTDGGNNFTSAQKLGAGNWVLNGCPMDGGGIIETTAGDVQTVWRRKEKIFASEPGQLERAIGEGKSCTLTTTGGKTVYAWVENGEIVCLLPPGIKKVLSKGRFPVIKPINSQKILCVWENDQQIQTTVVTL